LELAPEQLDLAQFRSLAGHGRKQRLAGRCARAGALFRRALALWRGPALLDLDRLGVFEPYAIRLEEERTGLLLERIGVDLCQGRSIEVVGELKELCARHPMGEGFHQQLMLALYQTGRRVEALEVYGRVRQTMIDEIGIEPGPGLAATQRAILGGREMPAIGHAQSKSQGAARVCNPAILSG
jgi:DNA-binding SARP family transcriptional activator